jgi:hypothetical protein
MDYDCLLAPMKILLVHVTVGISQNALRHVVTQLLGTINVLIQQDFFFLYLRFQSFWRLVSENCQEFIASRVRLNMTN